MVVVVKPPVGGVGTVAAVVCPVPAVVGVEAGVVVDTVVAAEVVAVVVVVNGMEQPAVATDSHTFVTLLNSSFSLVHNLVVPSTEPKVHV
jgi:hypothetical protein